jgi:ferric-dicitrate binding protein FerR (iron transport regulator)
MANNSRAKSALPYLRQVLEDDYVQAELRSAAEGLREIYERTRKERTKATEDKRVYANLRRAATSIRNAAGALQRPEPPAKKRRGRKIATLAIAGGGCALLTMKLQKQYAATSRPDAPAPEPTPTTPTTSAPA